MSAPISAYVEAVTKRVYPQASNNRFALNESVKHLLALVQAVTVEEFAFIRSNVNGGSVSRDSEWQRLPARLELLSHRLEEEGRYVDADIAHQAFEALAQQIILESREDMTAQLDTSSEPPHAQRSAGYANPQGELNMADYDMSIHTNPDAAAWAKFYTESRDAFYRTKPEGQFDSEDNMLGWFANAMMAMHDHIKGVSVAVLDDGSAFFVADVPASAQIVEADAAMSSRPNEQGFPVVPAKRVTPKDPQAKAG